MIADAIRVVEEAKEQHPKIVRKLYELREKALKTGAKNGK